MSEDACEVCGERVVAGVQFCTSCGAYLGWREPGAPRDPAAPSATPAATPSTQPAAPAPAAPTPPTQTLSPVAAASPTELGTLPTAGAGPRCPQCATTNDASRRFCIKCGYFVGSATPSSMLPRPAAAAKTPWWRRWLPHRSETDRSARKAFRKSLPLWIRLRRWLVVLAVLVLAGTFLHFVGRDPIAWVKQQIYALRGTVVAAKNITASSDPKTADPTGANAARAIDQKPDTAFTTNFAGGTAVAGTPCARTAEQTALDLTSKTELTARAINIQAGLPDNLNRQAFWRPTVLDLEFSDGSCQSVTLQDVAGWQLVRFSAVRTTSVRITIAAANPPSGGSTSTQTAITEVQLMVRPS